MRRSIALTILATVIVSLAPVDAQNEASLRSFFEGKPITLLMDLPGTNEGTLSVVTLTFIHGSEKITGEFGEDVLISFTIARA